MIPKAAQSARRALAPQFAAPGAIYGIGGEVLSTQPLAVSVGTSVVLGAGPGGKALVGTGSGTSGTTVSGYAWPSGVTAYTLIAICRIVGTGATQEILERDFTSRRVFQFRKNISNQLELIGFTTGPSPAFATTTATIPSGVIPVVGIQNGTALSVYMPGAEATGTIGGSPQSLDNAVAIGIGWNGTSGFASPINGEVYAWAILPTAISPSVARAYVNGDPWKLFAPRRIWVPRTVAGGNSFFQSLTASTTASASVVKAPAAIRSASATTSASKVASVNIIRSAAVTCSAVLTSIKTKLLTLAASVTSSATVVRTVGAVRLAGVTVGGSVAKMIRRTLAASAAVVAFLTTIGGAIGAMPIHANVLRAASRVRVLAAAVRDRVLKFKE